MKTTSQQTTAARTLIAMNPGDRAVWAEVERDFRMEAAEFDLDGDLDNAPQCDCCLGRMGTTEVYDRGARDETAYIVVSHKVRVVSVDCGDTEFWVCNDCADSFDALIAEENLSLRSELDDAIDAATAAVRAIPANDITVSLRARALGALGEIYEAARAGRAS